MKYQIWPGVEEFDKKSDIKKRWREIFHVVEDYGQEVPYEYWFFLIGLFSYHDNWTEKLGCGFYKITRERNSEYGTSCFMLHRNDGTSTFVSLSHCMDNLNHGQQPQKLKNFKKAARFAVESQIDSFRNGQLKIRPVCSISGAALCRKECEVDHTAPYTFDTLLFNFCEERRINPMRVLTGALGEVHGCPEDPNPNFKDETLKRAWQNYHQEHAILRLLSKKEHRKLQKGKKNNWDQVLSI